MVFSNCIDDVKSTRIYERLSRLTPHDDGTLENNPTSLVQHINDAHHTRLPSIIQRPTHLHSIHRRRDALGYCRQQPNAWRRRRIRSNTYYTRGDYPQQSSVRLNSVKQVVEPNNILFTNICASTTQPHRTNTNTGEFMLLDYIISDILTQELTDVLGTNSNTDISNGGVIRGLQDNEIIYGVIDASYNSTIYRNFYSSCPIDLDFFIENERITQIVGCGHIYKHEPLSRWFGRDTKCPLCRFELRINSKQRDIKDTVNPEREIFAIVSNIPSVIHSIDLSTNLGYQSE